MMTRQLWALLTTTAVAAMVVVAHGADTREVDVWLARVGARVVDYFARAQSILCEETVRIEPLGTDLLPSGAHIRTLVYELRVEWVPANPGDDAASLPDATVVRRLMTVDGRAPRANEEPGCFDRDPVSPEPLAMLMPGHQREYVFMWKGEGRESGRAAIALDYKTAHPKPATVIPKGDCAKIELPTRGRVWLDAATADVLRLDEQLAGQYDVPVPKTWQDRRLSSSSTFTVERADSSTVYRPITFHDPEETVILPASIISVQVMRNAGTPRLRTYQTFSKYRRFVTDARIVQ